MGALITMLGQEALKSVVKDAGKDVAGTGQSNPFQQLMGQQMQGQEQPQQEQAGQAPVLPDIRKLWEFNPVMNYGGPRG